MAIITQQDEESFDDLWRKAILSFGNITGQELVQKRNQSLEDVHQLLKRRLDTTDSDTGHKAAKVREYATNVLSFVHLLGGIAAQGASIVFGPANLCFNAVDFLFRIPVKISKFYDELGQLFEQIQNFMTQFKIYKRVEQFTHIDIELKESTHKLMICFIDICALSIETLSGSRLKRFKNLTKIALFDDDSGVNAKLEDFKRLVELHSNISDAITLEHVLKSENEITSSMQAVFQRLSEASEESGKRLDERSQEIQNELKSTHDDVRAVKTGQDVLIQAVNERTTAKDLDDQMEQITKNLGVSLSTAFKTKDDLEQLRRDSLEGTGSWLDHVDLYADWINLASEANPVLLLSGPTGCGKSYLVSAILEQLKDAPQKSSMRASIACYCFGNTEKSPLSLPNKDTKPSIVALKYMAVQLAKSNKLYAKNLLVNLKAKDPAFSRGMTANELFAFLFSPNTMRDSTDMSYILLFESLDQLSTEEARQIFNATNTLTWSKGIRIAFTGKTDTFLDCCQSLDKDLDSFPSINITDNNESDIKRYIDFKIQKSKAFRSKEADVLDIVSAIREKVPSLAEGNFSKVDILLGRLEEAVQSGIEAEGCKNLISRETLEKNDGAAQIVRLIQKLNDTLTRSEIIQLKEMLMWLVYANGSFTVECMLEILLFRTGLKPRQLESIVIDKYSQLLQVVSEDDDSCIYLKSEKYDDVEGAFSKVARPKKADVSETDNDPRITMSININNVKLSKVQRFLWDLSEKVVLDKFEFTKSFNDELTSTTIVTGPPDAHLLIIGCCFEVLFKDPKDTTKRLAQYALKLLPWHLNALKDCSTGNSLEPSEETQIVRNLVDVLHNPSYIEQHLSLEFIECWFFWLLDDYGLPAMEWWLRHSQATANLSRPELKWLKEVNDGRRASILQRIAAMIARQWLRETKFPAPSAYHWITRFLNKNEEVHKETSPGEEKLLHDSKKSLESKNESLHGDEDVVSKASLPPLEAIQRAAAWAEKQLSMPEDKDALWFGRLGETYAAFEETERAKQALSRAKTLPNTSYHVSESLARIHATEKNKPAAIEELDVAIVNLKEKVKVNDDAKSDLRNNLILSARWQNDLGDVTSAVARLREAIELDPDHYKGKYELLRVFVDVGKQSEALQILQELSTKHEKNSNLTQFGSMLLEFCSWDEPFAYFDTVFRATKDHPMFQVTLETIESTLSFAKVGKSSAAVDLLVSQGMALTRQNTEHKQTESALQHWRDCLKLGCGIWQKLDSVLLAAECIFNHHYSASRFLSTDDPEFKVHEVAIEKALRDSNEAFYGASQGFAPLARFNYRAGRAGKARELLLDEFKSGLDWLADDDVENDWLGYGTVGSILLHSGDDLNALSAFSLRGPPERHSKTQSHTPTNSDEDPQPTAQQTKKRSAVAYECSGQCNNPITYDDGVWACKVCDVARFDDACLKNFQNGTLTRFVRCSRDHEWLWIPSWEAEFAKTGRNRVRTGGEIKENGEWIGGEIVPVEQWLDGVREAWGIEKPTRQLVESDD